ALKLLRHGPWFEMFENREAHVVFLELETLAAMEFSDMEDSEVKRARPKQAPVKNRPPSSEAEGGS
ncbi:MAG: hypothetical protein ACLPSF_10930, partial [Methylocella sp.]